MTGPDDDLTPWRDDPLVRALREPGTVDELSGEADYLATFRAAQPSPAPTPIGSGRLRRAGRRLGGGGSAVVVAVALGAGAAAAYTQNLPEPVQRAVHGVFGPVGVPGPSPTAEGPEADRRTPPEETPGTTAPDDTATGSPSSPSSSPTDDPSDSPTPSQSPSESPSESPTDSPSESPTDSPTESPTPTLAPLPPAAVTVAGTTHRAGPEAQVAMSGTVTAADGTVVAGEQVVLLQRVEGTWQAVGTATSDSAGSVSVSTPALARTSVFRLGVGEGLTSQRWRVVLVPEVAMSSEPSSTGTGTAIVVSARGGQPGDLVALHRRQPGGSVLVARSRLADDLTATFRVVTPTERTRFVARLPRTRAHADARDALRLVPLKPQTVSATTPVDVLGPADQVTVSGTVRGERDVALPGRTVRLLLRTTGGDWRRVGTAVSDTTGTASFLVGPLEGNIGVRLRVGKVRSAVVRLGLRPAWTSSAAPDDGAAVITGTASGGDAGDQVLLRTTVDGRLVTVQQGTLGPGGVVSFAVQPSAQRQRYRLVLLRTPRHLPAMGSVVVRSTA